LNAKNVYNFTCRAHFVFFPLPVSSDPTLTELLLVQAKEPCEEKNHACLTIMRNEENEEGRDVSVEIPLWQGINSKKST